MPHRRTAMELAEAGVGTGLIEGLLETAARLKRAAIKRIIVGGNGMLALPATYFHTTVVPTGTLSSFGVRCCRQYYLGAAPAADRYCAAAVG
ncbi:MAG: hypothetical protein U0074_02705 [Kouleothrix sp.]